MNVHLDTHVAIWLHRGDADRIGRAALRTLRVHRPVISPMVQAELAILHDLGRLPVPPAQLVNELREQIDLGVSEASFPRVAARFASVTWTRDPFDRMIVAHALCDDVPLLTADRRLLEHCPIAVWD